MHNTEIFLPQGSDTLVHILIHTKSPYYVLMENMQTPTEQSYFLKVHFVGVKHHASTAMKK